MLATVAELASYLKKDVDTSTATLNLQNASALFTTRAATAFVPTDEMFEDIARGQYEVRLPYRFVTDVSEVRIISPITGTRIITDYTRIKQVLYRLLGFGIPCRYPPDKLEVDVTHGMAACPDDVRGAVIETAATAYQAPDMTVGSEAIDDYSYRSATNFGGLMLTPSAAMLADLYRGTYAA
jgi:hypothetical protein